MYRGPVWGNEQLDRSNAALCALVEGARWAAPDQLAGVVAASAAVANWSANVYLADYAQRRLVALPGDSRARPAAIEIDGTIAGRAYRTLMPAVSSDELEARVWLPLLNGMERLGVVEICPASRIVDKQGLDDMDRFAQIVAYALASKSDFADSFHIARIGAPRTVAAELVWSLLPPLTMTTSQVAIAGLLEPAEQVAGDVFDCAIEGDVTHVAIVDATGHDLNASVVGSLALAAYRSGRRQYDSLSDVTTFVNNTLADYAAYTYATGIFATLRLDRGTFSYVNAGHPSPLLIRRGRVVKSLEGGRRILLGLGGQAPTAAEEQLEPGDTIVMYTDGVVEARDGGKNFFGLERFIDILERSAAAQQTAPETLRGVMHRLLDHQQGLLQDDATVLLLTWLPTLPRR